MTLTTFTVVQHLALFTPGGAGVTGHVTFTPIFNPGDVDQTTGQSPALGLIPNATPAQFVNGQLLAMDAVSPVTLYCDQSALNLSTPLYYSVTYSGMQAGTQVLGIKPFTFQASATANATVDLHDVAPAPGVAAVGIAGIPSSGITDATPYSRGFLTGADNAADARAYLGITAPEAGTRVQVADNCYNACLGTGTFSGTFRFFYHVGVSASDLSLVFANYNVNNSPLTDNDNTTSFTFTAAIEDANGAIFPVTAGGARSMVLGPGAILTTDPVSIDVTAGDTIWVRVFTASGTYQSTRAYVGVTGGGGVSGGTDLTAAGSGAVADAGSLGFGPGPVAIVGTPLSSQTTPKSVIEFGDSIVSTSDGPIGPYGGYFPSRPWLTGGGFVLRAITGQAGFINAAVTGDQVQWFNANAGHFRRSVLAKYARYAFIEYGTNDLGVSRTAAQVQADILKLATRNKAHGVVKNIVMTLLPNSSSTDGWMTTGNQTPNSTKLTTRVTYNNWVRDGGPIDPSSLAPVAAGTHPALRFGDVGHPISAYLEVADVVESARDSSKWKVVGRSVNDAVATSGSNIITSATANFTNADIGSSLFIAGAETSGANFIKNVIDGVTNSTTVTLSTAGGAGTYPHTTVSGALMTIGALTGDGLHPNTSGHAYIAAAIQTQLLALLT